MKTIVALLAVSAMLMAVPAAALAKLGIGDTAPKLEVSTWVKGEPVTLEAAKGKNVVVLEFWATWCGPCIASIPHLNELQAEYADKGVVLVGVTTEDPDNSLEKVQEFVKKRGDKLGYRIAFDKEGKANAAFMEAAQQPGIPTAFVIDKEGRIAWIGHPMDGLDRVLADLVAGKHDIEMARKKFDLYGQGAQAMQDGEWEKVVQIADQYLALDPTSAHAWQAKVMAYAGPLEQPDKAKETAAKAVEALKDNAEGLAMLAGLLVSDDNEGGMNDLALKAVTRAAELSPKDVQVRSAQYHVLAANGKDDEALAVATQTVDLMAGDAPALASFARTLSSPDAKERCNDLALKAVELALSAEPDEPRHLMTKFYIVATCKKDAGAAEGIGRYLLEKAADNADLLNELSWTLLTEEGLAGKFNALALAAAEQCHKVSEGKNWMYLDTLALAKFENGAAAEAVELEKKAIELCDLEPAKPQLKEALARFEQELKK